MKEMIEEKARTLSIADECDVIVCGGGPAGVAAAVAAAREGAKTRLIENNGCLGGIWTAGLISYIIDWQNKDGLLREIMDALETRGAKGEKNTYDIEATKFLLEEICMEAGVKINLHTRLCGAVTNETKKINAVISESKSGRLAWKAKNFIDCTGDGDLAAFAGCGYDMGNEPTKEIQPASMAALVTGIKHEEMKPFLIPLDGPDSHKQKLLQILTDAGTPPSYEKPTFFHIHDNLYGLMSNHEYNVHADNEEEITNATINGRREVNIQINALRSLGGMWKDLRLVATSEHIGIREGRRIHGKYTITKDDLINGKEHDDAVCRSTFGVDIHATDPTKNKGYYNSGIKAKPYDIPMRALMSKDIENLLMAGRCISGDFYAHASYRVTGDAVAMGEAAGKYAAKNS
jgi:hypothetical protein